MDSTDFKQRLMTVLKEAVANFNESHDPDAAIVKSAKDNNFNVEQTQRLVEVFNVARTLYHYKTAGDRTTSVSLADGPSVVAALFSEPRPCLSDDMLKRASDSAYMSYDLEEVNFRGFGEDTVKAASWGEDIFTVQDRPTTMGKVAQQAADAVASTKQAATVAAEEAALCALKAEQTIEKLASFFRVAGDRSQTEDQYARLMAVYSKNAEWRPVLARFAEYVSPVYWPSSKQVKQARALNVIDTSDLEDYVGLMKEARGWLESEAELLAASGMLGKEASAFEREWWQAARGVDSTADDPTAADFLTFPSTVKRAAVVPGKGPEPSPGRDFFGGIGEGVLDTIDGPADYAMDKVKDHVSRTTDMDAILGAGERRKENVRLSSKLENVQRQLMLEDLMATDPVLADMDPEDVVQSYKALLRMSPGVSQNKEVVRAILRQSTSSVAISPYDATTWTALEKNLHALQGGPGKSRESNKARSGGHKDEK